MAVKSLDIHPSALAELKSSISWYLEQNEATADKFVEEIDRAIDLVLASPRRWPTSDLDTRSCPPSFSLCGDLPRKEISG
jgi:plasmid stabilization system protein ParE